MTHDSKNDRDGNGEWELPVDMAYELRADRDSGKGSGSRRRT